MNILKQNKTKFKLKNYIALYLYSIFQKQNINKNRKKNIPFKD